MRGPDKLTIFPLQHYKRLCFLKNIVKYPNIPYSVVGGNPAILIRKRFSDEIIQQLLEIKMWDGDIEKITSNRKWLTG